MTLKRTWMDTVRGLVNVDMFSFPAFSCVVNTGFFGRFWLALLTPLPCSSSPRCTAYIPASFGIYTSTTFQTRQKTRGPYLP